MPSAEFEQKNTPLRTGTGCFQHAKENLDFLNVYGVQATLAFDRFKRNTIILTNGS